MKKRIGLIDVDGHNFPNIPLMKLSAWHKKQGDSVVWYEVFQHGFPKKPLDRVYISKIFSFTPDYEYFVNADEVIKGGSGYCIELKDGREVYNAENDGQLQPEIEHIYPDYSLYPELTKDTAYGFMSRGCPRGCQFCHVGAKEGRCAQKVANLSEFWDGQKYIKLLDPNPAACKDWQEIFGQLAESGAWVDFTQGLDIRIMTQKKIAALMEIKVGQVHFAWDSYEDKEMIVPRLKEFAEMTGWGRKKMSVYVLTNFNTTLDQDLDRVYTLRDMGFTPYVMIYNKQNVERGSELRRLQRWVNSKIGFWACKDFKDFR